MNIFGSKKIGKVIAVLELASDSVGGMLIRQNKEDRPEIIASARTPVNFLLDVNFEAFWRCAKEGLKKTLKKLLDNYPSGPDAAVCVFLSPWFIPYSKIIHIQKDKPFKITRNFLEDLLKNEEENFKKEWSLKQGSLRGKPEIIEHEIIKMEINGYHVFSLFNKIAKEIKAHIYVSLGIKEVKQEIEKEILKNFGAVDLSFKTFPLVSFKVLKNIMNAGEGFVMVDIGGEITEVFSIRKNCIEEIVSFPRGKNFMLRKIASNFNALPQEVVSLLNTYFQGHLSDKDKIKIDDIMKKSEEEWCNFFRKALESINENSPLSQDLFLIGDKEISDKFIKCAENSNFSNFTTLGKPFNAQKIAAGGVEHYFKGKSNDVFLMIESLFVNKTL